MATEPPTFPEVGAPLNKASVNAQLAEAAQMFKRGLDKLVVLFEWQGAYTAEMLEAIGFTADEANLLKSGLAEVPPINDATDATQFLKRFWGTGV
jgi:hypothetical protein